MQTLNGTLLLSASDLVAFLECPHLTRLDLGAAEGTVPRPELIDPELDVVRYRGAEHERFVLNKYIETGATVAQIKLESSTVYGYKDAHDRTLDAMRTGADVIYQAVLLEGMWLGIVDFLEKVSRPSEFGGFSYEVVDTKLARHAKAAALVQTALYSSLLSLVQRSNPETMHLILGDRIRQSFRVADYTAYAEIARRHLEDACKTRSLTYPEPVPHCAVCRWREACNAQWVADDHLTLIAGLRRDQAERLQGAGVDTLAKLAAAPDDFSVTGISAGPLRRLQRQASLQVRGRTEHRLIYELIASTAGLGELPAPSPDDLFLDIEGDPFVDGGLEYLFGLASIEGGTPSYRSYWAHSREQEQRAFKSLINDIIERLDRNPSLHVFHYAPYEQTAIKRLAAAHRSCELEVDRLLRGGILVDLYQVVRRSLQASVESYGLKAIERFYRREDRVGSIHDAGSSIVAYETWLKDGRQSQLDEIEEYNRDDCISTIGLRDWLEVLRQEYERSFGPLPRPTLVEDPTQPEQVQRDRDTQELYERLAGDVPTDNAARTVEQRARWLLAESLLFHRREQKAEWWSYFDRLEMTMPELVEDPDALGDLTYAGVVGQVKRSLIHRYSYPFQEHKIFAGTSPLDPRTGRPSGIVVDVDQIERWIDLRRGADSGVPHPEALVPAPPPNALPLRLAISAAADWVVTNGFDAPGPYRAIRDLLLGRPRLPTVSEPNANQTAVAMVSDLDQTCLGIQGPPGSGKTSTGAKMVLRLIRSGRRVGLTALSHKVIGHFLEAVSKEAQQQGFYLRALQKCEPEEHCGLSEVKRCSTNDEIATALRDEAADVVAGTAWLFADPSLSGLIHTLFVDEAGQVPLANVVATSRATENIVLLGDPNQLAQPVHGTHPDGAAPSALDQLLNGAVTMPEGRGLFLDTSWRMHPRICQFVSQIAYEGRLHSAPATELQSVGGFSGLHVITVDHVGNRTSSIEEAHEVKRIVESIIGLQWTDATGLSRRLTPEDILILAPYNSQVALLGRMLPDFRVGTVDKLQGQEAAVSIYSMATSTPDDVPHGVDFLYSLNRLNVAISRARAMSIVVFSAKLLLLHPEDPDRLRLANALCRLFLEGTALAVGG